MIKKIILATNNAHKIEEFQDMFSKYNVEIISLSDAGISCDPEENGKTFKDNALIKAEAISKFSSLPIISDDSGLEIDALNGFPGVYSARFMEGRSYDEKRIELNNRLKDIENKSAHFKTVLCLYVKNEEPLFFEGQADGRIVPSTGDSGFAYDPIFYCYELKKTFGEASKDEKNSVSHRGKALQKLVEYLINTKQIEK